MLFRSFPSHDTGPLSSTPNFSHTGLSPTMASVSLNPYAFGRIPSHISLVYPTSYFRFVQGPISKKLVGEKQNELQQIKEKKIDEVKDKIGKLSPLVAAGIGLFIKLPMLDPKILATIAFLKGQKELREEKQKVSKENLKNAKENFTYPIKPIDAPTTPPPPPPLTEAAGPPPATSTYIKPKTNYYVEIREQKNAWVAEVFLANPRSFQDTKSYSKANYQTRQAAIDRITNDARSAGLVGLPPEPGFTFPGTRT